MVTRKKITPFILRIRIYKWSFWVYFHQSQIHSNTATKSHTNLSMNFAIIIIVLLSSCISGARLGSTSLGFHGSKYHFGQFWNLSPQQVAMIKKLMKIKCQRNHGRFCWANQTTKTHAIIAVPICNQSHHGTPMNQVLYAKLTIHFLRQALFLF